MIAFILKKIEKLIHIYFVGIVIESPALHCYGGNSVSPVIEKDQISYHSRRLATSGMLQSA